MINIFEEDATHVGYSIPRIHLRFRMDDVRVINICVACQKALPSRYGEILKYLVHNHVLYFRTRC
jgi:hypothetical protein